MIVDTADAGRAAFFRGFDVCVIGAGPAGITLARRLAERGLGVALMEGGGLEVEGESQDLYAGAVTGLAYHDLETVRLRAFGGSSGHWGGRTRVLDPQDFMALPHRPGWPIDKTALDPHQPDAAAILDLTAPTEAPDLPVTQAANRFREIPWRKSEPPTRFGTKYRDEIAASRSIVLGLHANLVDLRLGPDLATVEAAVFRSYDPADPGFEIKARAYALCLGGLENPRFLLNCTRQKPAGLGNDHDLVGRYFCEHPILFRAARILYRRPPEIEQYHLAPTLDFMLREQVLNFTMRLIWRPSPRELEDALAATAQCLTPLAERLADRVLGRPPVCNWGGVEEYFTRRDPDTHPWGWVQMATEQSLQRDSRVRLTGETDPLGLRRMALDWRLGEMDQRTIQTALVALGQHMAEQDAGRVRGDLGLLDDPMVLPPTTANVMNGSYHHMCTTRMSADPRQGVVDSDCRVHGLANLYVGGSSVFATPGYANPTLTLVQLALRLGDHLGADLQA